MRRRVLQLLGLAALLALAGIAWAQRDVLLSFSTLKLGGSNRINAMAADETNRVWAGSDAGGVVALIGDQIAPFFPLNQNDGLLANDVRAVAFAKVSGQENFFLGFDQGVQYGRVLASTGLSKPVGLLAPQERLVNALATDGAKSLWVGTQELLVEWDITGQAPSRKTPVFTGLVQKIAVAPWTTAGAQGPVPDPAAVFASGGDLYLVRSGGSNPVRLLSADLSSISGITFDKSGNLWVCEGDPTTGSPKEVVRYGGVELQTAPQAALPTVFLFNPPDVSTPRVNGIAVEPFTNTVWLATGQGAYSQAPNASGSLSPTAWTLYQPTRFDRVDAVFADSSGNLWFGVDQGIRIALVRLLAFSSGRYVGEGPKAQLTLEDLTFKDNGKPGESVTVKVTVGGSTKDLTATESTDSGSFTATFGFSLSTESATVFKVASSPTGVPVEAKYAFTDALGNPQTLTALSSWANEVPFEDDLLVGGPCFLSSLRL